ARCAHGNRGHNRQNRRLGREPCNAHRYIGQALRFVFGQKNDLRSTSKRFDVGGISQPPGSHIPSNDFFQVLFEERNVSLSHFDHARPVGMTAGNWSAKIRQAGRNHRSQVPRTVNSDLHVFSPFGSKPASELAFRRDWRILDLLFIYSRVRGFSMHGREMYLKQSARDGSNSASNRAKITGVYRETRRRPRGTGARSTQQCSTSSRTKASFSNRMRRLPV